MSDIAIIAGEIMSRYWTLLVAGALAFAASASAIAAEKDIFEADAAGLVGGASKVADNAASGGNLVSLTKPGQGVRFTGLPAASKLAIRYASVSVGTISVVVNERSPRKVNVHSSGALTNSFLHSIVELAIPANSTLTISLGTNDVPVNIDRIVVGEGDFTRGEPVRFTIVKASGKSANVLFRIPHGLSKPAALTLNGKVKERAGKPSTYVSLKRKWKAGDVVTLTLPASLRLERAKDDSSMVSLFFGPVLLAGELGRENMPNDSADPDANMKTPAVPVPDITASSKDPANWLQPLPNSNLAFKVHDAGPADGITFRPLYDVHHQRYSVYWRLAETSTKTTP